MLAPRSITNSVSTRRRAWLRSLCAIRTETSLPLSEAMTSARRFESAGTRLLLLDEPFEGVAPALSKRLADVIASLKGSEVSVLMAQSDLNHARRLVDTEVVIERGANVEAEAA